MSLPAPTQRQARVLWFSLTALAVGIVLALLGLLLWGAGWLINQLSAVLLPLAIAGVIAYLLDPVVDFLERRLKVPRPRAILLVFFMAVMLVLILLATVVPRVVVETDQLLDQLPEYTRQLRQKFGDWLAQSPRGQQAKEAWDAKYGEAVQKWLSQAFPIMLAWIWAHLTNVASWAGYLIGLALVPVYAFYFLLEKEGIQRRWPDYLPLHESKAKEEVVFVLKAINDCLVVFFRGQVLVALCSGTLLAVGLLILEVNYAVLLGAMAAVLGIVPYVGVMITLAFTLTLTVIQFGDWFHPIMVMMVFALVQMAEGLFVSPKIIGNRVGLHPLTIIIAVMVGTTLMGGILGGVLAIPLTAALRTLMFRYVWKKRGA